VEDEREAAWAVEQALVPESARHMNAGTAAYMLRDKVTNLRRLTLGISGPLCRPGTGAGWALRQLPGKTVKAPARVTCLSCRELLRDWGIPLTWGAPR
jgi:hypothetical protein